MQHPPYYSSNSLEDIRLNTIKRKISDIPNHSNKSKVGEERFVFEKQLYISLKI
jgi:hypothetical protein